MDRNCELCGAPIEVIRRYELTGEGFGPSGTECIVTMAKVLCAAGHRYDAVERSVEI